MFYFKSSLRRVCVPRGYRLLIKRRSYKCWPCILSCCFLFSNDLVPFSNPRFRNPGSPGVWRGCGISSIANPLIYAWIYGTRMGCGWNANCTRTPKMERRWNSDPTYYSISGIKKGDISIILMTGSETLLNPRNCKTELGRATL